MRALLDARQREKIVDKPRHAARLLAHDREKAIARDRIVACGALQGFDKTQDRRQRRAQLMTDIGDKVDAHPLDAADLAQVAQRQHHHARQAGDVNRCDIDVEKALDGHAFEPLHVLRFARCKGACDRVENVRGTQAAN
jgi:hypothetical protein